MIFSREPIRKTNEWDYIAGAWECIPSQTNVPITKRVEFCHSSWKANPLLYVLSRDNREGIHPRFVRLQVDTEDDGYTINLYDIDYRTWSVRCIWQGPRLLAFGVAKNFIYCDDSREWFRIDARTGAISKPTQFVPLDVDGEFWIVRKVDEKSGSWSYDPNTEQFIGHFRDVDEPWPGDTRSLLSSDGKNRARVLVPRPKGDWADGVVRGTFLLQRHGFGEDVRVPVELFAIPGSGRPIIPIGINLQFTKGGTIEFAAIPKRNADEERVWSINVASGKVSESVRPHVTPKDVSPIAFGGVPAPDYLQPYLKELQHFGGGSLAPAFLMHLGILKQRPEFPDCAVGVSGDGRYILYKAKNGPLTDVFICGDLKTKQTVRWACPVELKDDNAMAFVWVETP
ncbi:MAG TPA: hypothetical protein VFZ59_23725 [Verrucomicrobiae bacterium]|nr:hypothetical protein [Verrucomicrobiae bacterium]